MNNQLYNKIINNISYAVKRILNEEIQNFNPVDYQDTEQDIIDNDTVNNITQLAPKNKQQLENIIIKRAEENPKKPYLNDIDTCLITDMSNLFRHPVCSNIEILDLSEWDTSNVTTMKQMFYALNNVKYIIFSKMFDTSQVKSMRGMFEYCESLVELDLSSFNISNVKNIDYMFCGCYNLQELDISHFNFKSNQKAMHLFENCKQLKTLKLPKTMGLYSLNDTRYMFSGCESLEFIDFGELNIFSYYMQLMFCNCKLLRKINMPNLIIDDETVMIKTFYGCSSLQELNIPDYAIRQIRKNVNKNTCFAHASDYIKQLFKY